MTQNQAEKIFLEELDKKLWNAADKLRSQMDAANYKHIVLGMIFLKYVSDSFVERRDRLGLELRNPESEYFLDPVDYAPEEYEEMIRDSLEVKDYYTAENIFWVPVESRWESIRDASMIESGNPLPWNPEKKMRSVSLLIDDALESIEKSNGRLKGILSRIGMYEVSEATLIQLINLFSDANFATRKFGEKTLASKDILGHVYEYFLGQFALAEGKKGGQYFTPKSIVKLVVEMLQPCKGRVYDPAMGSGGFFVQNDHFLAAKADELNLDPIKKKKMVSVYGQEANPTTWKLAAMNMVIRNIEFDFGKGPADTFLEDQHKDLRADFVMANPPFNMKEWWHGKLEDDRRWQYGKPSEGNANFAWMQHMIYHLNPTGSMGLLLANGSMSSGTGGEGDIRKNIIEADLVECMVALPGQLFTNTQIPACIWFLIRSKEASKGKRDRKGQVLFIDAREKGYMRDRVLRDFTDQDIKDIGDTLHNWQKGEGYEDILGFCKSVTLDDIRKHDHILTPGRYVGIQEAEDDGIPFAEKMADLTKKLNAQLEESHRLETEIRKNLRGLGYEMD